MKIRSAKKSDEDAIRRLWHDCFSDPYEYIDFYIKKRFEAKFCAILELDGEVVGMVHLLPCTVHPNQKALYWYAAGIRSDRRNQGLFRKFAEFVKEKTNEMGFQNICVPAPGLEEFYQSIGFEFSYTANDEIATNAKNVGIKEQIHFEEASSQDFINLFTPGFGDTLWDEKAIKYAIEENAYCGGRALRFNVENKQICFFAIKKDNGFLIDYHNMTEEEFSKVKNAIFYELNCYQLVFRTGGNEKIVGLRDSNIAGIGSRITMTLA